MKNLFKFGFGALVVAMLFYGCSNETTYVNVVSPNSPQDSHTHTFETKWTSDDTYHWHAATCGHTSEKKDNATHTPGNWIVETEATFTSAGVEKATCTVCSKKITRTIPMLESLSGSATLLSNKVINGVEYSKTEEIDICTVNTTVVMTDDSSWNSYVKESANDGWKGVFIKNRSVTLSPFAMGKYEVTQELFEAVMGANSSEFSSSPTNGEVQKLRAVENVSWYDAIAFCNKLSILEGLDPCYAVKGVNFATLTYSRIPKESNAEWDAAVCDFNKKGYRLPTEAEWEYTARGGKDNTTWGNSYAGVNTSKDPDSFAVWPPYDDVAIEAYAWYDNNSSDITHEVGLKKPNSLGLYDMSGNVYEWCWDWYSDTVEMGAVINPKGPSTGSKRIFRGGSWDTFPELCAVSCRNNGEPYRRTAVFGFRLARSLR